MPPTGPPADHELLDRLAAGDEDALAQLYDRYSATVYGLALHLLADVDRAADVTEAVFVELWTRAHHYVHVAMPLRPLLTGLTHDHALRVARVRRANRVTPLVANMSRCGGLPWN